MKKLIVVILAFLSLSVCAQKSSTELTKEKYYKYYTHMCQELNKQLPVQVDEMTTLYFATFLDGTLFTKYRVDLNLDELTDDEILELKTVNRFEFIESVKKNVGK